MKEPTKKEIATLKDVNKRSKGWPVGIPIEEKIARSLIEKNLAQWAVPAYNYGEDVFAVRLTSLGKAYI